MSDHGVLIDSFDRFSGQSFSTLCQIYLAGFRGLPLQDNSHDSVRDYHKKVKSIFTNMDMPMRDLLIKNDTANSDILVAWANRMNMCVEKLSFLEKTVTLPHDRWSWTLVISAMVYLEALKQQATLMLLNNGIEWCEESTPD